MFIFVKFSLANEFSYHAFPVRSALNLAETYIYSPEEFIWQLAFIFYYLLSFRQ